MQGRRDGGGLGRRRSPARRRLDGGDDRWGPPVGVSRRRARESVVGGGCWVGWATCFVGLRRNGGLPRGKIWWSGLSASKPARRKGEAPAVFELLGWARKEGMLE
jgi:hypothetical protein